MANLTGKTVNLNLISMDGNAYNLMAQFQKQAKREGWTNEEIEKVLTECQAGDYDHLLGTLLDHSNVDEFETDEPVDEEEYEEEKY